ncbi:hypothetical protein ACWDUL_21205 [Nocardia niigatensis]
MAVQVRHNGWRTYVVAVGEPNDDLHYDPESMRNLEFLTVRFYTVKPILADLTKSTEVGRRTDADTIALMDAATGPSLLQRVNDLWRTPREMAYATVEEMQEIVELLDKAEAAKSD